MARRARRTNAWSRYITAGRRRRDAPARLSRGDPEDLPLLGNALEPLAAAVLEAEARTGGEVANGPTHEHLAGAGHGSYAGADVHRHATPVVAAALALADV